MFNHCRTPITFGQNIISTIGHLPKTPRWGGCFTFGYSISYLGVMGYVIVVRRERLQ